MRRRRDEEVRLSLVNELNISRNTPSPTPITVTPDKVVVPVEVRNPRESGESVLDEENELLGGEELLELADEEIEALERELGEPPPSVAVGLVMS